MDRQTTCGFCDGTGLWADADGDVATPDPCPLCEGSGSTPGPQAGVMPPPALAVPPTVEDLASALGELTPAERQELYEILHARWDCRIYRH